MSNPTDPTAAPASRWPFGAPPPPGGDTAPPAAPEEPAGPTAEQQAEWASFRDWQAQQTADREDRAAAGLPEPGVDGCEYCGASFDNPTGEELGYCWKCGHGSRQDPSHPQNYPTIEERRARKAAR